MLIFCLFVSLGLLVTSIVNSRAVSARIMENQTKKEKSDRLIVKLETIYYQLEELDVFLVVQTDNRYNQKVTIQIACVNGNIVQQLNNATFTNGQLAINTTALNNGLYFVTIANTNYKKVYKVVKQ